MNTDPLFLLEVKRSAIPKKVLKDLRPVNPDAQLPFQTVFDLLQRRRLGSTLLEYATSKRDKRILSALAALERKGLHRGISFSDVALELGCTAQTAQKYFLDLELKIYALAGLHIGNFDSCGTVRLGLDRDVIAKQRRIQRGAQAKQLRQDIYCKTLRGLLPSSGTVQMDLFTFPEVKREA